MPTFVHGKDTKVYLDEFEMTDYFNSADVALTNDTAEVTAYGATSKSYLLGMYGLLEIIEPYLHMACIL